MYNGLTTADKTALLDAKADGANWIARDADGFLYGYTGRPKKRDNIDEWDYYQLGERIKSPSLLLFIQWFDTEPVNIDLALAQIAEMESRAFNAMLPIYLDRANEHIAKIESAEKPMTNRDALIRKWSEDVESMAKRLIESDLEDGGYFFDSVETRSGRAYADCYQVALDGEIAFLNSQYTEGETK